jgi:spoIIIJ-associated protein
LNKVVVRARSVEEAVELACRRLGLTRDRVEVHVLQEPKRGFLGLFGRRDAEVEAEAKVDHVEEAVSFLTEVLKKMGVTGVSVELAKRSSRTVTLELHGEPLRVLIGKRGKTLESLQELVNLVANRKGFRPVQFLLDAGGYRKQREETLIAFAGRMAAKVLRTGQEVMLEAMPAAERKIIHRTIPKMGGLTTHSVGEEPDRRVVIRLKAE